MGHQTIVKCVKSGAIVVILLLFFTIGGIIMARHVNPPSSDDLITRHQFYAEISRDMRETNDDIDGMGRKVTSMYDKLDMIGDKVKEYATKGNTISACITVLWFLLGSGLTMYVNSVIDAAKHTVETVAELEKKVIMLETTNTNNAPHIESIEKIKRNLATLQQEVQEKQQ
jgi:muramoyltetrapeptide carboxypeptidase LdcA involved in peptidoglycan recycling